MAMNKLTEGTWRPGNRAARYRCIVDDATAATMARHGIALGFDAISVGNEHAQVALFPLDNPNAENDARLLCHAKPLLDGAVRFLAVLTEIGKKAQSGKAMDDADVSALAHISIDLALIVAKFRPEVLP